MLWIGSSLGSVERACMRSVLRQGHELSLYCYAPPAGVPEGVALRDAAELVPEREIVRHRGGSVALFANLFRYRLLQEGRGIWLDCDIYLLAPISREDEHLFGEEAPGRINNAVLRMPPDSPLLTPLIALFDDRDVPAWIPLGARLAARWRLATTGRAGLSRMPWGVAGPLALTALAREYGLSAQALPPEIFYPMPWQQADWIRDPERRLEDVTTPRTVAVHLWNERIRHFKNAPAPPGSFLARLQREGAPSGSAG
jgi:alpha 1,4-glycosyltransferase